MAARQYLGHSTAVYVRLVAFLVALAGIVSIPAACVATSTGHITHQAAIWVLGGAAAAIVAAVLLVRPLDPLRG